MYYKDDPLYQFFKYNNTSENSRKKYFSTEIIELKNQNSYRDWIEYIDAKFHLYNIPNSDRGIFINKIIKQIEYETKKIISVIMYNEGFNSRLHVIFNYDHLRNIFEYFLENLNEAKIND